MSSPRTMTAPAARHDDTSSGWAPLLVVLAGTPQVLAILGTVYAGARRGTAFAAFGFAMGIAGVLGQLLGGALIQADVAGLGWRAIFLINIPVGVIAVPLARRFVPESRGSEMRFDPVGTVLAVAGLTALILPLAEGREQGWPRWTVLCLGAAPVPGLCFARQQRGRARTGRAPLVDPGLFRAPGFATGSVVAMTFATIPPAFFFVLALYLQQARGYGPLFSGVVFVAVGVGYFAAMIVANRLVARLGHHVLSLGSVCVSAGCVLLADEARAPSALALLAGLALAGFGIGAVLVPISATVLAGVDPAHAGAASGVLATAQQVGGAVGVALIGVLFFGGTDVAGSFALCARVLAVVGVLVAALAQLRHA